MIEWKQRPSGMHKAECGDLTLEAFDYDSKFRAIVSVEERELLNAFDFDTLDAAKLAAETFAREWVATQAAALGMRCVDAWHVWVATQAAALGDGGEWTSALPTEPGWYWTRTSKGGPILLDRLTPSTSLAYWGKYFRRWSVSVEPPPLPVAEEEE